MLRSYTACDICALPCLKARNDDVRSDGYICDGLILSQMFAIGLSCVLLLNLILEGQEKVPEDLLPDLIFQHGL